jgi:hypothetical protein
MSGIDERAGAHASVARALGRLDAYSFFVVPGHDWDADFAVVGTTGAFLITVCDLPGLAQVEARRPVVGEAPVRGLRKLRSGAKRFTNRLGAAATFASAVPIVCLTRAVAGPPVDGAGVRFAKVADLAREISARPAVQSHTRAQTAARALGVRIAGDQQRHFTVRT